jgi:DNA gyrase/topoisomerase IV subunit A
VISQDKIEEWIQEVEERPGSAPNILRYIARRLADLSARNEELLADNLALRTGRRVEEYESRIANLEYQVELLKRQVGADPASASSDAGPDSAPAEQAALVLFTSAGQALRLPLDPAGPSDDRPAAVLKDPHQSPQDTPRLLTTSLAEELLFLFDSGRVLTQPAAALPAGDPAGLDWARAVRHEPQVGEELAAVLPVARMSLFEFVVQTSRRGHVKKLREDFFENHLANHYIGSGVRLAADRTCGLTLCGKDDLFVLVTREGAVFAMEVSRLPFTIEEALRLGPSDHVLTSFVTRGKDSLVLVTQTGKVIHREAAWLEPAASFKGRGQPAFSRARREAGVRLAGAAAVNESDWAAALDSQGRIWLHSIADLCSRGSLPAGEAGAEILSFSAAG